MNTKKLLMTILYFLHFTLSIILGIYIGNTFQTTVQLTVAFLILPYVIIGILIIMYVTYKEWLCWVRDEEEQDAQS